MSKKSSVEVKTKIGPSASKKTEKSIYTEVFEPLERLIDGDIKNTVRNPLINAQIQYLKLDNEQKSTYNLLVANAEKQIYELQQNLNNAIIKKREELKKSTGLTAKTIKSEIAELKAQIKQVEYNYLVETFGQTDKDGIVKFTYKGKPIGIATLKTLAEVATGNKPGNWEQLTAVGKVIGIDSSQWDKGHESASVMSIKLAGILRSTSLTKESKDIVRKLLEVSRQIDNIDETLLKPFLKSGSITDAQGFTLIGELIKSNVNEVSINSTIAKEIVEDTIAGVASNKFTVTFEAVGLNRIKGRLSRIIGMLLSDVLQKRALSTEVEKIFNNLNAANLTGSKSTSNSVENILTNLLIDKKGKAHKDKEKHKLGKLNFLRGIKNSSSKKIKIVNKDPNKSMNKIINYFKVNPDDKYIDVNLSSTQSLINKMLAIEVEKQMASSSQNDGRLRYQTGRFASSAELLTLTRSQAGILAGTYTYQRDPYDVFLPGGRLGTPKRDPRLYVKGAIREAAFAALKDKFKGISLELK